MNKSTLALLSLASLSLMAPAAQADDGLAQRAATGVGYWIAAQGNAALREIQREFEQQLRQTLQPLLPDAAPASAGAVETGLPAVDIPPATVTYSL
ncbi:MAG TPA: hypothetical protein VFV27_01595 [Nevskiaceae bacterium]|nr:hypothetical protein [Nevskiaceae bacterium]